MTKVWVSLDEHRGQFSIQQLQWAADVHVSTLTWVLRTQCYWTKLLYYHSIPISPARLHPANRAAVSMVTGRVCASLRKIIMDVPLLNLHLYRLSVCLCVGVFVVVRSFQYIFTPQSAAAEFTGVWGDCLRAVQWWKMAPSVALQRTSALMVKRFAYKCQSSFILRQHGDSCVISLLKGSVIALEEH